MLASPFKIRRSTRDRRRERFRSKAVRRSRLRSPSKREEGSHVLTPLDKACNETIFHTNTRAVLLVQHRFNDCAGR
jgi:hypothetical protein